MYSKYMRVYLLQFQPHYL